MNDGEKETVMDQGDPLIPGLCSVGDPLYGLMATNLTPAQARVQVEADTGGGVKPRIHVQGSKPKPWWAWT